MRPPKASCKRLYELDKDLRFGWEGRERTHRDDLNAGQFVLIRLMPRSKVKGGFGDSWYCIWGENDGAGPMFDRYGNVTHSGDWTSDLVPVIEKRIPEAEKYLVLSGTWIEWFARTRAPKYVWDKLNWDVARAAGQAKEDKIQETVDLVAGDWLRKAKEHTERAPMLLKEEVRAQLDADDHWQKIHTKDDSATFKNWYVDKHGLKKPEMP